MICNGSFQKISKTFLNRGKKAAVSDIITHINQFITEFGANVWGMVRGHTWQQWLYLLFPFFIFAEMPRYVIPAIVVPILSLFKRGRRKEAARRAAFLATEPLVSIIVPARNEGKVIRDSIISLLETGYKNKQIIVIDDASTDNTYAIAKKFADKGQIALLRNTSSEGRGGKAFAMNLALNLCKGDYIIQVDADTTFDRTTLEEMLAPFADPKVGAVTGNIKVRNASANIVTKFQACEYLLSITLWRNWASRLGILLQIAGGLSCFRRSILNDVGGWDSELVEDADLTIKVRKLGYKTIFAKAAVAFTTVPETLNGLAAQRRRWERGFFRTFFRKHVDVMIPWRFHFSNFIELLLQFFFTILCPYMYYCYIVALLIWRPELVPIFLVASYIIYEIFFFLLLLSAISLSERRKEEWGYLIYVLILPLVNEYLRFVRAISYILELLRIRYEDPHLPAKAWKHSPRW
jgi:cellulose synthase/poly-beta-1,6-N-acetylglucosamine synthase-like glycosyltransferase